MMTSATTIPAAKLPNTMDAGMMMFENFFKVFIAVVFYWLFFAYKSFHYAKILQVNEKICTKPI